MFFDILLIDPELIFEHFWNMQGPRNVMRGLQGGEGPKTNVMRSTCKHTPEAITKHMGTFGEVFAVLWNAQFAAGERNSQHFMLIDIFI